MITVPEPLMQIIVIIVGMVSLGLMFIVVILDFYEERKKYGAKIKKS